MQNRKEFRQKRHNRSRKRRVVNIIFGMRVGNKYRFQTLGLGCVTQDFKKLYSLNFLFAFEVLG
jgi:hypothetical protein